MTYIIYSIVCIFIVVFQTTLKMSFSIFSGMYDLFLLVVIYLGFFRRPRESLPFIIIFGSVMDAISGGPFGLYLTSYFWLYLVVLWLTRFMRVGNNMILPLIVFGSVLFQNIIVLGTMALLDPNTKVPVSSAQVVLSQILWAVVTGPVLILFFRRANEAWEKWMRRFQPDYGWRAD